MTTAVLEADATVIVFIICVTVFLVACQLKKQ